MKYPFLVYLKDGRKIDCEAKTQKQAEKWALSIWIKDQIESVKQISKYPVFRD